MNREEKSASHSDRQAREKEKEKEKGGEIGEEKKRSTWYFKDAIKGK